MPRSTWSELHGEESLSRAQIDEEIADGQRRTQAAARRERERGMYLTPHEISRRWLDKKMVAAWKNKQIPGDPPPVIQRAFDREGARLLRQEFRS